jgi:hypothetical protein
MLAAKPPAPRAERSPMVASTDSAPVPDCTVADADQSCATHAPTAVRSLSATDGSRTVPQRSRRGRPPKVREWETEFVEWWKPGWREKLR